jgi:hypothetical protein
LQTERNENPRAMTNDEALIAILKRSHDNIVAGRSFSQEEAEAFINQRMYEIRDKMDT